MKTILITLILILPGLAQAASPRTIIECHKYTIPPGCGPRGHSHSLRVTQNADSTFSLYFQNEDLGLNPQSYEINESVVYMYKSFLGALLRLDTIDQNNNTKKSYVVSDQKNTPIVEFDENQCL